jgi:hypothetical protein
MPEPHTTSQSPLETPAPTYQVTARYGAEGLREGLAFAGGIATTTDRALADHFRDLGYVVDEVRQSADADKPANAD